MVFIVFVFAVVIGSFLNVCIYRIPAEKSVVSPPSSCGTCNKRLAIKDLIPIFSYLFLRGKCRYCNSKVSIRYLLVELFTGILISIIYLNFGLTYLFFKYSILTFFLIVIALIDYDTTDVYSVTTIPAIILGIVFAVIESFNGAISIGSYFINLFYALLGGLICFGVIAGICYLTGAMGEGDIEIAVLGGIFIGWKLSIFMLLFSFIIGGILGVSLILLRKKKKTDYIPFGPSLAIGIYVMFNLGINFINNYIYNF